MNKEDKEEKRRVVLTGTYEGSYNKFGHTRANRYDNKKINLIISKLFSKRRKK